MPRTFGLKGPWILLGLGGLAAAGALAIHRFRSRPQGNRDVSPEDALEPAASDPGIQAPDLGIQTPDQNPERTPDGMASPGSEPWLEPLRMAMERSPHLFGYGKSTWTAPLLTSYLQDTQGLEVPLSAVRKALKDLGYRWEHTRYVQARAGALAGGSASERMG